MTIHLILSKFWFDHIKSGRLKEDHRAFKPYYHSRFKRIYPTDLGEVTTVTFSNGYGKNRRQLVVEFLSVEKRFGRMMCGLTHVEFYALCLGKIINTK